MMNNYAEILSNDDLLSLIDPNKVERYSTHIEHCTQSTNSLKLLDVLGDIGTSSIGVG